MENGDEELELFDSNLLKELEFSDSPVNFSNGISNNNPGESLVMRSLKTSDFDKGYIQLLGQLTDASNTTKEMFLERFHSMRGCKDTYYVTVIEDTSSSRIVAGAILEIEQKFTRQCAVRGRIEEVVVLEEYRGKQLGKLLLTTLTLLSKKLGCYKLSLECSEENIPFYEKFGLKPHTECYMVARFRPK